MCTQATFPIFVFDGNDLSLFESVDSLVTSLEGIDVEDGVYQAYDSQGREVTLEAHGVLRGRFMVEIGRVAVGAVSPTPSSEMFRSKLLSFLESRGQATRLEDGMAELVHVCVKRARGKNGDV